MDEFDFSKTYYKITNKEEIHHGYQYHDGLNVDPNPWSTELCSAGGFYFSDIKYVFGWINYSDIVGYYVREVTVPEDAVVNMEIRKFKANKIILGERKELGDINTIKYLVEQGVDVHTNNDYALYWAVGKGYLNVVKYLIECGANKDCALCWAATANRLDAVKYLVECGADIHADDERALRWAASNGHLEIVKYLVEQGADIHADSEYALRWAAYSGHLDVVKYLKEQDDRRKRK